MGIVKIHTYQKRRNEAPPASPAFLLRKADTYIGQLCAVQEVTF